MKAISYVWLIIRNLIVVSIVFLLLSVAATKFEIAVLSILVLILIHQVGFQELLAFGIYEQNLFIGRSFRDVLKELKSQDTTGTQKMISDGETILSGAQTKLMINSAFYYLIWLVIILKIVSIMI